MQTDENKKLLLKALSKVCKELRGKISQSELSARGDMSTSIINLIDHGKKDPQLTTFFKLAEMYNMPACEFIKLIQAELPEDFSLIEN